MPWRAKTSSSATAEAHIHADQQPVGQRPTAGPVDFAPVRCSALAVHAALRQGYSSHPPPEHCSKSGMKNQGTEHGPKTWSLPYFPNRDNKRLRGHRARRGCKRSIEVIAHTEAHSIRGKVVRRVSSQCLLTTYLCAPQANPLNTMKAEQKQSETLDRQAE